MGTSTLAMISKYEYRWNCLHAVVYGKITITKVILSTPKATMFFSLS